MKKILVYILVGFLIISNIASATIFAVSESDLSENTIMIASSNTDFWGQASKWFSKGNTSGNQYGENIIGTLENMVLVLGTTVIVLATIVLGIKFMYGSVDSKVDAKEGLFNLLVACLFFFGWNSIKSLLMPGNEFIFISDSDTSYTQPIGRVFSIATYAAQIVAVIAIIYVGIRYIFAGVQGRTELKEKSGVFIIGVILAFCSTGFLTYVSRIINDAL